MNFHIDLAAFREGCANCAACQLRRVAVAAEMSEHHALDFSQEQFLDDVRRRYVREVTMTRLDSLFYRPRPMRIILQEFFVMIRFNDERLDLAQPFHNHFRRVAEIGDETEAA